jgi:hypothetical protein
MALEDLKLNDETSGDLGGYFHVTITDLDLATQYPLQFQYIYADKRLNDNWSAVKYFTTVGATVPNDPQLQSADVVGGAGFIKVSWSGNDASGNAISNFDRVDVHISGTTFGDGTKPAGSFKTSGTQSFVCVAGVYIVQLKVYSLNGASSFFSTARTVTVTSSAPAAESSVTPSTPTVSSVLGAIQLSWNGKTSSGGDQPYGFNAAKVYVGTSAGFTPSSSNQVDVLNFANGQNTLNIGVGTIVNGTALDYGIDYYIKIATTNGTDTSTAVSATSNPVRVGQVTSGDIVTVTADKIATGTLSSGSTITVGSTSGKHIKLSGTGDPFIIYGSGGVSNPVLSYNGTKLTVVGDGTFSGALSAATGTFTGTLSAATGSFSGTITASGGTVGGIYIAAGAIQNDVGGSQFKLDSSGKARFGSATGNAIVINPTASNGGYYLYHTSGGDSGSASSAFSISTSGILTATGANFSGTITNSTSSDYWNSNGTFRFGGSNGITYNGTTISMGSIVSMPAAQITGTITANAIVSNATITSPTIAGGIFRTASSGLRIVINETANKIDIYPDSSSSPGYISASSVSSYGSLKLASPYASGFSQSNIQLYSLGSSLAYIQLTANVTSLTGGLTVSAGSLFSGDADFSSNIIATGAINATTLTPAPNTYITTSGQIRRTSGSSIRFKKDVVDLLSVVELDPKKLYDLPVRAFKYKNEFVSDEDSRYNKLIPGFIAEEVEEVYPIAADYDLNGVEKWNANVMVPAMLALIQDLNTRLDALEA